ncbi:NAD(P)-binding protein [Schizophyllum commune Loenen D]|nr:NAD(P)-binding protein [Schizophyllum commune Loenen D]
MPVIQRPVPQLPESLDLTGKTAIITGGNTGLGLETAKQFLQRGLSHLILAVRTPTKGEDAKRQLLAGPQVAKRAQAPTIAIFRLDLTSHASLVEFAARVEREVPAVDILLLNAGIYPFNFELSPETKNEIGYQVNHLSNAILAILLLPVLQRTGGPAHITVLGSRMATRHTFNKRPVDLEKPVAAHFNDPKNFNFVSHYGDTKFIIQSFLRALSAKVDSNRVIVNAICPGQVNTNLGSQDGAPRWAALIRPITNLRGRTPDVGARCVVFASAAAGQDSHGTLVCDMAVSAPIPYMETPVGRAMEEKIWKEALEAAEGVAPGSPAKAGLV